MKKKKVSPERVERRKEPRMSNEFYSSYKKFIELLGQLEAKKENTTNS